MRLTVAALLCFLVVFYLYGPEQSSAVRRRIRRRTATSWWCDQKYRCNLKYMLNNTVYEPNDAFLPVNATKFNLCRTGGDECTEYKNCRSKYLSRDGTTIMENLDPWTATHVGSVTTQPKPESVLVCSRAPYGIIQNGTIMTIAASIIISMATGLCTLRP